jgi:ATP-dependent helicase/nuclease subunit A
MVEMTDASRAQVTAANPESSTWLSANAGSGKTRVLTDRVARLLLDQVPPERILCLTYTKAAASEMQNRLFKRLGEWAMLDDTPLRDQLTDLGVVQVLDAELLARARTLFARAIETPGGLKIQTIHSFCAAVLRRFPLEAGVAPGFTEIEDRQRKRLVTDLLDTLAATPDGQAAVDGLVRYLSGEDQLTALALSVVGQAEVLDPPETRAEICSWLGIDPEMTGDDIIARVVMGDEAAMCARIVPLLDPTKTNQTKTHAVLSSLDWAEITLADLEILEDVLLFGGTAKAPFGAKIDAFINKPIRDAMGADLARLHGLMLRVEAARPLRLALETAARTDALHRFAELMLPAYAAAKAARGWLDFDDLIRRTRDLLNKPGVAPWVLFRLDGGIDHILVDEAQDTAPIQWQIVAKLAEDFAAGQGARADVARTIFVVGDKKQSIYSFQGADPEGFDRMRGHFQDRLTQIGAPFQSEELIWSFRSAPAILQVVDTVAAGAGGPGLGGDVRHRAFFDALPGRVDLWPHVPPAEKPATPDWHDPVDQRVEDHHYTVLANRVADGVAAMLSDGTTIVVNAVRRRVRPEDILILVQSRSDLFHDIIGAIKARDLPISGPDRMRVAAQLAVKDMIALMAFLATPEDDLSLAAVLRSPLAGWSEAALFDLAHGRPDRAFLWQALRNDAADHPGTMAMLTDLRNRADFLRPYDLLERVLIRHDGRRRLLARLGPEAEDGIDAMLAQALAYEQTEVPSLTGLVGWLQGDDVTIKRDPAGLTHQIRVMTVHGAKGLESPIVMLPDCKMPEGNRSGPDLLQPEGGPLIWGGAVNSLPPAVQEAALLRKRKAEEERNRLLYVALTRAETWVIVAAAGKVGDAPEKSWFLSVQSALQAVGARSVITPDGPMLRHETGDWPMLDPGQDTAVPLRATLPDWAETQAPVVPRDRAARSPSDLGGAKALPGDGGGLSEDAALRRGRLVHLLLEHLPDLPPPAWHDAAPGIAALDGPVPDAAMLAPLLAEATRVLTAPRLAHVFAPGALAEVELTAHSPTLDCQLIGAIDRLVVSGDAVLAVDFKTNAVVPDTPGAVPEGLLRQLGAYAEMLAAIYPGRRIDTAILWSRDASLMIVPNDTVMAALRRAATP